MTPPASDSAEQILSLYTKGKSKEDYKILPDTISKDKQIASIKAVAWHVAYALR